MVAQVISSTENNFTKGLITEFTGLNFPENAATDTDNCIYTLVGDVTRREGINYEENFATVPLTRDDIAINSYKWNNAGGDGESQLIVVQSGATLRFYAVTEASVAAPLSAQKLTATVDISAFTAQNVSFDPTSEAQFTDGNGYLFIYHPSCDPFFCSYDPTVAGITPTLIQVQIRDFVGVLEPGIPVNLRQTGNLPNNHLYNLINQGWTQGSPWIAQTPAGSSDPAVPPPNTAVNFQIGTGISAITNGDLVSISIVNTRTPGGVTIPSGTSVMSGTINGYNSSTGVLSVIVTGNNLAAQGSSLGPYNITPYNHGYINTWETEVGNFPSNADVWWYFKDNTGTFNPVTTVSQVTLNSGPAPKGHFILSAFNQDRGLISGVPTLTPVTTSARPTNGTWFQGRVWYTGVNASQQASGTSDFYTWTENIYFSQTVTDPSQFGQCYQTNDPTSEDLFDLLPTDGGVIQIQGAGAIYKLFPIQNGMLVFAANGIWFITGSQGIGFSANDYTITKISSVKSISSTSLVDVQGLPYFWNEEGIYSIQPSQNGSLSVEPITVGTILSFYNDIPLVSKQYARGAYDPINYIIQWVFRSSDDGNDVTARYEYNRMLNFNTFNKAFYPYTVSESTGVTINGAIYVSGPNVNSPAPSIKFLTTSATGNFTFSDENSGDYVDWFSADGVGVNYESYFVTGYKLHGQGQKRFQLPYIYVYSDASTATAYKIQSIWDYANSPLSGKYSSSQLIYNNKPYFGMIFRRHRLRGQGIVLQIKITSVDGQPFDIMGWSTYENLNQGV